ncbi:MAG: magnesium transporter [Erysipelotrichaceae bacterium]|jgi:magnesium transporter|nr:magnesium transporter [Erysipelotrichaceae bacterium]
MTKEEFLALSKEQQKALLNETHPFDVAKILEQLDEDEVINTLKLVKKDQQTEILSYLDEVLAAEILEKLPQKHRVGLVENLEPDDAADILQELDEETKQEILNAIDKDSKDDIDNLIQYSDSETGSVMNPNIFRFNENLDVKDVTKEVMKKAPEVENISYIYVVDSNDRFLGVVSLKELLRAKTPCLVGTIKDERHFVTDHEPLFNSSKAMRDYDINELPVVDDNLKLLGVISIDDAMDAYQEEAIEDFQKLSALPAQKGKGFFLNAIKRLPWLIVLLVLSLPIAMVTSTFEAILSKIALLMIFTPLILDASGDVATQTLAITLKTLVNNERAIKKVTLKEILTGLINGFIMGSVAFVAALIFTFILPGLDVHRYFLAFVVGLSLWISVTIAPLLGFIIPFFFTKIKVDASVASGPFITSIIDIASLLIYLGTATLLLGNIS